MKLNELVLRVSEIINSPWQEPHFETEIESDDERIPEEYGQLLVDAVVVDYFKEKAGKDE